MKKFLFLTNEIYCTEKQTTNRFMINNKTMAQRKIYISYSHFVIYQLLLQYCTVSMLAMVLYHSWVCLLGP